MTGFDSYLHPLMNLEPVALIVLILIGISLLQGFSRGARRSTQHLFHFLWEGILMIVSLMTAGKLAQLLSGPSSRWLQEHVHVPQREMGAVEQGWYTFLTSVRDLPLLRLAVLFLAGYLLLRFVFSFLTPTAWRLVGWAALPRQREEGDERPGFALRAASRAAGAIIGGLHGIGRSIVLLAVLFLYVSLFPAASLSAGIESSPVYRQTADKLLEPVAGGLLHDSGPVISEAVGSEFQQILQRKYEIIDYNIPSDINKAAETSSPAHRPTATRRSVCMTGWASGFPTIGIRRMPTRPAACGRNRRLRRRSPRAKACA